ncbi:MAG TPA: THUMP domain-containing protein, partial [Burkholderiaceae bacterium]|nr:THUMP domain-containing protein [Burkholderiaceae bacterium]
AGVEAFLADEVQAIAGGRGGDAGRGGVALRADAALAMRLNLESRLAQRVLWRVAEARYRNEDELYALARGVRWVDWITPKQTLRVDTTARSAPVKSLNFASLRIKDAVCDSVREAVGARPDVDTRDPDLSLVLHLDGDLATLYVDTSGVPLFKRGWRDAQAGDAPLKETLAAALLVAAGWRGLAEDAPLLDPCCGSGTIAIEAAHIACDRAPGLARRFAFEKLLPFRDHVTAWRDMVSAAKARVHPSRVPIFAGDVSFRMTDFAQRHAERAGVASAIQFKAGDMLQRPPPASAGTMVLNPPYGERLSPKGRGAAPRPAREQVQGAPDMRSFYAALAAHWKRHYAGWTAWVLSPDTKLPAQMRLKESRRVPLWNGPIECRLFRFDLTARRTPDAAPPAA